MLLTWDTAGNLLSRQDLKQSLTETFDYDALNRLTGSQRNGTQNLTLTYNAIGNILTKSDVGSYTYHATRKRAVIQAGSTVYGYDANGNMTSRGGSSISYTSYNLPSLMNQGSNSSAVSYGAFRNRFKQVTAGSDPTTTIYVAGLLERVTRPGGVTEFRHQIHGPTGTVAIYTRRSSGTADTYYLHRDHLGSPELITNAAGTQIVKPSFAAFGERRGSTWTGTPSSGDWTAIGNVTRRGFTDHEHLDNVGLIHMNGRVYDPRIGRFLSPDPFIDWGLGTQGVNRYGYVGNNPLNRIDPTGFTCQPSAGMSDEEAAAEISRCADQFDAGGWGPNNGNQSKWCDLLGDCRLSLGDSIPGFGVTTRDGAGRDPAYTASMVGPNVRVALDQYNARFERRITLEIGCGADTGLGCGDWAATPKASIDLRYLSNAHAQAGAGGAAVFWAGTELTRHVGGNGDHARALARTGETALRQWSRVGLILQGTVTAVSYGSDSFLFDLLDLGVYGGLHFATPYAGAFLSFAYSSAGGSRGLAMTPSAISASSRQAVSEMNAMTWRIMTCQGFSCRH
jgi:RHS repeat-associated protein